MKLTLTLHSDATIAVDCQLTVPHGNYSFALLDTLLPGAFLNNGMPCRPVSVEDCRLPFRPPLKKYTFSSLQSGALSFHYTGPLKGFFRFLQKELYHLSFYNAWYPMGFDADTQFDVTVVHDNSLLLIGGVYDAKAAAWRYQPQHQAFSDCNILLYDPKCCRRFENDAVCMLFFDAQAEALADAFFSAYKNILHFYETLYGRAPSGFSTIVFLPQLKHCPGAYIRDNLIVFGQNDADADGTLHILAHELGHAYATGADTESWEDWLNETHAEWSALLYALSENPALFERQLTAYRSRYNRAALSLRPDGNKRPNDVHIAGTLLYERIYRKYGCCAIKTLLTAFDLLPNKTSAHFLAVINQINPALADEIRACM